MHSIPLGNVTHPPVIPPMARIAAARGEFPITDASTLSISAGGGHFILSGPQYSARGGGVVDGGCGVAGKGGGAG